MCEKDLANLLRPGDEITTTLGNKIIVGAVHPDGEVADRWWIEPQGADEYTWWVPLANVVRVNGKDISASPHSSAEKNMPTAQPQPLGYEHPLERAPLSWFTILAFTSALLSCPCFDKIILTDQLMRRLGLDYEGRRNLQFAVGALPMLLSFILNLAAFSVHRLWPNQRRGYGLAIAGITIAGFWILLMIFVISMDGMFPATGPRN